MIRNHETPHPSYPLSAPRFHIHSKQKKIVMRKKMENQYQTQLQKIIEENVTNGLGFDKITTYKNPFLDNK
jgi:hypothetical protein